MNIENLTTIKDLEHFIQGNQAVESAVLSDKHQRYQFVQKTLIKFGYVTLPKRNTIPADLSSLYNGSHRRHDNMLLMCHQRCYVEYT